MQKFIIDGVEYSYGERVIVDEECERILVGYIENAAYPIICVANDCEEDFKKGEIFNTRTWVTIKKLHPLSGRKITFTLDGKEYNAVIE